MGRDTIKLLILAGIVAFAVMYGMELSSRGITDVNGSWETDGTVSGPQPPGDEEWPVPTRHTPVRPEPVPSTEPYVGWNPQADDIPRNDREPLVDRVSGKTAEVLHQLSRNGIRFVVSLFDRVTG